MSPTGEIFNQCKLSPWIPDHEGYVDYDDDNIDCHSDDKTDDDQDYADHT